jgi:hypothetical protein
MEGRASARFEHHRDVRLHRQCPARVV